MLNLKVLYSLERKQAGLGRQVLTLLYVTKFFLNLQQREFCRSIKIKSLPRVFFLFSLY